MTARASAPYDASSNASEPRGSRAVEPPYQPPIEMLTVRFGTDSSLELELANDAQATVCAAPRGTPLADVSAAASECLRNPLAFPPLSQAAVPGDKVVLAIEPAVPRIGAIVLPAVQILLDAGIEESDITILMARPAMTDAGPGELHPLPELQAAGLTSVVMRSHDPRDRESLSYLAADSEANPIYINRAIHDADLVVSIGVLRLPSSLGYHGIHSGLYPTFSDAATRARFRSPKFMSGEQQAELRKQADEVGWLLGTRFTIQVVPGAADDVLHVVAGDQQAVLAEGEKLCADAWRFEVPRRVDLVLATLGGDQGQQTWECLGRALAAAALVLNQEGDVIVCSQLEEPPGMGLERIIGADDLSVALREIAREKPADSLPATQLGQALLRGKVYLLSNLDERLVEELGILPVDAEAIVSVASRYGSCVVLENAQYAQARLSSDSQSAKSRSRKSRS